MTGEALRVLYASRAFESAHTEGGFLLLRDLAERAASGAQVRPAFFSTTPAPENRGGVDLLPAYRRGDWGILNALRFGRSLRGRAASFDVVHTAHVATPMNSYVLRRIRKRAGAAGTRFVQTITALAADKEPIAEMFWGDAVVCLNEATASEVRRYREDVAVIPPAVRPERLAARKRLPADIEVRLEGQRVICIPADLARLGDLDLNSLCAALLESRADSIVVVACRFGEDELARRLLGSLAENNDGRLQIFATIEWILDLYAASDVVLYPIGKLRGKFNPPLALLEAAALGARIVAPAAVVPDSLLRSGCAAQPAQADLADWVAGVSRMLDADAADHEIDTGFDAMYTRYVALYRTLLDAADE